LTDLDREVVGPRIGDDRRKPGQLVYDGSRPRCRIGPWR
jgi:hypothetical protein